MKIFRTYNPDRFIEILNHKSVKRWQTLPGDDLVDMRPFVKDRNNILLMAEKDGAMFFQMIRPGVYEVHTSFLPNIRGKQAVEIGLKAADWMFENTEASEIWTRVPSNNLAAKALTVRVNGHYDHTNEKEWPTENGLVDVHYYKMTVDDWLHSKR